MIIWTNVKTAIVLLFRKIIFSCLEFETDRYYFLKTVPIFEVKYRRASLIIVKIEFAHRPIFKMSNIGR